LEYDNIILYNFISAEDKQYQQICEGVTPSDLQKELKYSRNKDKHDKSLEIYKFYINALYVALTRAVSNLY
jgi:ATP-dependent exoDNAse (exonuclease V) beta subunit